MPGRENGKRRYFIYDLSTALEELRFTRAFGPGILAAVFYGVISGSMSFINKVGKVRLFSDDNLVLEDFIEGLTKTHRGVVLLVICSRF